VSPRQEADHLSIVMHELRNPLVGIEAAARILAKDLKAHPAGKQASAIASETRHMLALLESVWKKHPDPNIATSYADLAAGPDVLWEALSERTRLVFDMYVDRDEKDDAADAMALWDTTNRQDWHICELAHLGSKVVAYGQGRYSAEEELVHAIDRHYVRRMDFLRPEE